jgi:hypothetical protein
MSNNPILPIIPNGGAPIDGTPAGDENDLPVNDPDLDEGETNDSEDQVDEDVREANAVNDHLEK